MHLDIRNELSDFTNGKSLILFTVTKDTVNFIRMYNDYETNFTIKAIIDLTMSVRPNVKAAIDSVRGSIPLYTSLHDYERIVDTNDIVIQFESVTYHKRLEQQVEVFDCNKWNIDEFQNKIIETYNNYIADEGGNEWNFAIHHRHFSMLNTFILFQEKIKFLTSVNQFAYIGARKNSGISSSEECEIIDQRLYNDFIYDPLDFTLESLTIPIYDLCYKQVRNQKVHFVFSTDYAGGKFNYMYQQNKPFLDENLWIALIDKDKYFNCQRMPISVAIHKALTQNEYFNGHDNDIYIKMEGSLLTYTYSFLLENQSSVDLQHIFSFFHDYTVDIIHKDSESLESIDQLISEFCKMHYIDPDKVRLITNHNNSEYFTIDEV